MSSPDFILHRGLFTTLDRGNPTASAVAIKDGAFTAVGHDQEVMKLAGPSTKVIDLRGRRVLPGLIDNHLHIIRGGLNFNMELRWDGVWSLADAMAMLKRQVAITPPPQWVRVVGGFTEHQFAEKRLPTIDELNAAAPDSWSGRLYPRTSVLGVAGEHTEPRDECRVIPFITGQGTARRRRWLRDQSRSRLHLQGARHAGQFD